MMTVKTVGINERGRPIGQYSVGAKLTDHEVSLLLDLRTEGLGYKRLAKKFDISIRSVRDIVSFRRRGQAVANWKRVMVEDRASVTTNNTHSGNLTLISEFQE